MRNLILNGEIFHIKSRSLQQFQFEWHPKSSEVFLIKLIEGTSRATGELIANKIKDAATATQIAKAWIYGWRANKQVTK